MNRTLRILNVEDSARDAALLQRHLSKAGYELVFERVDTREAMRTALESQEWDAILADYTLPEFGALQALTLLKEMEVDLPFIIISGTIGEELAVEAVVAGADDYLMKDRLARLVPAIEREIEEARNRKARKQAEEERARLAAQLENERERLNTIIGNVPGVVWEAWGRPGAASQRIDFVSEYVETMLGYSIKEWLATPNFWLNVIHPDDKERVAREAAADFDDARYGRYDFRWIAKDGRILWVEAQTTTITDADGRPAGMCGVTLEVTERKRAEESVRESEERYRLLFDSNPLPSYVFDKETFRFLAVNEAMLRHYGYSREELMAMTILDIRPPEQAQVLIKELIEWPGGLYRGEWKHRKRDGSLIDVEITDHPLVFAGRPAYIVLAQDVTEQRMLESQFRQSQKMEAVGRLAGGVAHDFNNLLTVITGYTQLAISQMHDSDPLRHDFEQILKASFRASSLTRQLLAFSRKQVMQPRVLDLNSVISELEKMLRRLIGEDVQLSTVLAEDLRNVEADPGQIEQVIMNLAVNARDAMPRGGKLTIETANVDLSAEYVRHHIGMKPGPHVMLALSDTGFGMDADTQARIFEPFFTTKEAGKGTGLGLSTVYGIIKQSGGSIWVYSEVGRGATFKIYFPRSEKDPQEYKRPAEAAALLQGTETILLVEDDEMVRSLARQVLRVYGYSVLEAANGGAALLICERHTDPIHLLVTDVIMPEMSGQELAARLAPLRPGLKILFMSGYTDAAVVHHGVLDERIPFLQKPFAPETLARKVREVLDQAG